MYKIIILTLAVLLCSCNAGLKRKSQEMQEQRETIVSNSGGKGQEIVLDLYKGKSFYYPLLAIWIEDINGRYIQTLYVARSVATGTFKFGAEEKNKWTQAPKRAPQTLPYWAHKRGVRATDGLLMPEPQNPVPDSYSGATPITGFTLVSKADSALPVNFSVLMEINQNWDWNEYWTNDKYPDDEYYKMSCQPALVYRAEVDLRVSGDTYRMKPIGHSHYSGKTGELFPDLSTLTTAMHIADSVIVRIR